MELFQFYYVILYIIIISQLCYIKINKENQQKKRIKILILILLFNFESFQLFFSK